MKLLLFPLRLAVGWGLSPRLLGLIGATMLVLLRVSIGWHFYNEGVDKRDMPDWSAAPFFANATGPFAADYHQLVWDAEGQVRLDPEAMMLWWATFRDQVQDHYGFDDDQKRKAQDNYSKAVEQYNWVMAENAADIEEFKLGRQRIAQLYGLEVPAEDIETGATVDREKQVRDGVSSLGGQRATIRREWLQKATPALAQIDTISKNYELAQNSVATPEQVESRPPLRLIRPRTNRIDTSVIDEIVPYFDMAIGLCLLLGLFTPVAALAAAGFLGSVFLSQYPPETGPGSTYYHLAECMACLALAGTGAGRFAGLDYFLHLMVRKVYGSPPETA